MLLLLPFAFKLEKKEYLLILLIYSFPIALFLHFQPNELNLEANRVFFLPQLLLITILSVYGLKKVSRKFLPIAGTFLLTVSFIMSYQERIFNRNWTALDYISTVLEQTESDEDVYYPVIQSRGDALTFPLLYLEVLTGRIKVRVNTQGLKIHIEDMPDYSTYPDREFSIYDRMLFIKEEKEIGPWYFNIRRGRKDILEDELCIKALCRYSVYLDKGGDYGLSLSVLKKARNFAWLDQHRAIVASTYSEMKRHKESVDILKSIQRKSPLYPGIYHRLHYSLLKIGEIDEAASFLSKGLLNQDDADLLNDAGVYYAERGFTNTAFLFFLDGVFRETESSGENLTKLIQNDIQRKSNE